MLPYLNIFGLSVPTYSLCAVTAFLCCLALFTGNMKGADLPRERAAVFSCIVTLAALFGALALYKFACKLFFEEGYARPGCVLYGGLITGGLAAALLCRLYRLDNWLVFDKIAAVLPLGQGIGRIGCFLAGCCYGVEVPEGAGVVFRHPLSRTPLNVSLCPVQLYESLFDLLLFVTLRSMARSRLLRKNGILFLLYAFSYSVFRFAIEFLRGDAVRGIVFGLSTSQWISIFIAGIAAAVFPRVKAAAIDRLL